MAKIYKNLWAGHETYFVAMGFPVRSGRCEAKKTGGYGLVKIDDSWKFERATYYCHTLKDAEHFPVVGHIDMNKAMTECILKAIASSPEGGGED